LTLIVAAGCRDYAVLVADRRLSFDGQVREDESNKLFVLHSTGLRLAVAYTGVGQLGSFRTAEWLPERLRDAMQPDGILNLDQCCERATKDFAQFRSARPADLFLFLSIVGFVAAAETNERQLTRVLIGNAVLAEGEDRPQRGSFSWTGGVYSGGSPETFALVGGAIDRIYEPLRVELEQFLAMGRPSKAVVAQSVELIRGASQSDQRVSAQCSSIVLHRSGDMVYDYHTSVPTKTIYSPAVITPKSIFLGVRIERQGDGVASVPRVATGIPCPCRSGRRYGRCHGRPPARGVKPTFELSDDGGIRFVVGNHVLVDDTQAMIVDLKEDELPSTRRDRRRSGRLRKRSAGPN